jgi:putative membrane protein
MAETSPFVPPKARRVVFIILPMMYLAGIIGLNTPALAPYFQALTPFNLVASLGLLLLFHTDWSPSFLVYCLVAFLVGFGIEVAGVHTGAIFGEYSYGSVLGFKLWEVPILIGANWLMLTYLCGSITDRLPVPTVVKILVAAGLMTILDTLIEPVAIRLSFWQWHSPEIPLQNFIAWYFVSAALFFVYYRSKFQKKNELSSLLLALQFLFFGLNSIIHLLD